MLSICIPIYNFNVIRLVNDLDEQAKAIEIQYEIILIDDHSNNQTKQINKELTKVFSVKYIELNKNIGRSAIRNLFLKYAKFDSMLFLDCDSKLPDNQFIARYVKLCDGFEKVICGGTLYAAKLVGRKFNFRWKYGVAREINSAETRAKKPYQFFKTNNFVIHKNILASIRFDEKLTLYGYEDNLFAYRLKQQEIRIENIENPVIHDINETYDEYLFKTRQAIQNLYFIRMNFGLGEDFAAMIRLLKAFNLVKNYYLRIPILFIFIIIQPLISLYFKLGFFNLFLFDFYKLGYLILISTFPNEI